ncbi:L,D-transpeptidase family protein [Pollutimonas bauzanensis]|uniref:L,D-transpeptidase family protein n=1 Tax=Pollutimonas bauzanensis TaxID=658167 RepID=UPI00333F7748
MTPLSWKPTVRTILCSAMLALFAFSTGAQTPSGISGTNAATVEAPGIIPGVNVTNPDLFRDAQLQEALVPSWFERGRPGADAIHAIKTLADAETQGLNPQDYHVAELSRAFEQAANDLAERAMTAKLDDQLTEALVHYLRDLHQGRLNPEVLQHRFKAPPLSSFDPRSIIAEARTAGRLTQALNDAVPEVPMYESLRTTMNAYRAMGLPPAWQGTLPALPARSLKPGEEYTGLATVAARLIALGDLPPSTIVPTRYEGELVDAVRRFQIRHGLDGDGVIGPTTLAELNVAPPQRVRQMALTLERLRWTPLLYGPRMIVVNVPEFVLRAYETQGNRVKLDLEMRVIVGRALDTRTPIFLEDMRFIEFSPYWNVPRSIARSETLPKLRRDPAYFTQQGFEFVAQDGKIVHSLSSAAIDAVQRGEWRVRQRPGPRNALGDIKFIFPNDQNIYLHHTPAPQLFSRVRRDFSHGCIRIESPVQLARFVLHDNPEWTETRIDEAMKAGKSRTIKLEHPIPVLIAYSTAVVKNGGKVYFYPDIYKQDARLELALHDVGRAH